jgi:hypothetical protein
LGWLTAEQLEAGDVAHGVYPLYLWHVVQSAKAGHIQVISWDIFCQFGMLNIPKAVHLYHGYIHGISEYAMFMPFALCMQHDPFMTCTTFPVQALVKICPLFPHLDISGTHHAIFSRTIDILSEYSSVMQV